MSAINSGLSAITSTFNVITASAQAVESLARAGQIYASMAENHAQFHRDKQVLKNNHRLETLGGEKTERLLGRGSDLGRHSGGLHAGAQLLGRAGFILEDQEGHGGSLEHLAGRSEA